MLEKIDQFREELTAQRIARAERQGLLLAEHFFTNLMNSAGDLGLP